MEVKTLQAKLEKVKKMGYVVSMRKGNTGIGYTLETLLGIAENNIKLPDLGTIELKSKRKNVPTPVTMFTFNSGAWIIPQKDVIAKYGYIDKSSRTALKCFVAVKPNAQGLYLKVTPTSLQMYHNDGTFIAEWQADDLVRYFKNKMPAMLLVLADTKKVNGTEYFLYDEAYLLNEPTENSLLNAISSGLLLVDLRLHLKSSGGVRNRGTAFRMKETDLHYSFSKKENLL